MPEEITLLLKGFDVPQDGFLRFFATPGFEIDSFHNFQLLVQARRFSAPFFALLPPSIKKSEMSAFKPEKKNSTRSFKFLA